MTRVADGLTVDACVMRQFDEEVRHSLHGTARQLIDAVISDYGIVVDEGHKIQHEWLTTCQGPFFREWYLKQIYDRRIRTVRPVLQEQHKKRLQQLGLTQDPFDPVYVAVANATKLRYIISGDMHFYDPKLKCADAKSKYRARENRKGALCYFLRTELRITVGTITHAYSELVARKSAEPEGRVADP